MSRKATDTEERIAAGEQVLTEEFLGENLPRIKVKVVYLGGNPHKLVRLKGRLSILQESRLSIADLVTKMYGDRKWVQLLPEEQEAVRTELTSRQHEVLATDTVVKQEGEHYSNYDFSTVDALGRKLPHKTEGSRAKYTMTEDGHRFQWVEHFAHVVALNRMKDQDGSRQFEVRGSEPEIRAIKQYIERTRRVVNQDSGAPVLADMGLSEKD